MQGEGNNWSHLIFLQTKLKPSAIRTCQIDRNFKSTLSYLPHPRLHTPKRRCTEISFHPKRASVFICLLPLALPLSLPTVLNKGPRRLSSSALPVLLCCLLSISSQQSLCSTLNEGSSASSVSHPHFCVPCSFIDDMCHCLFSQ